MGGGSSKPAAVPGNVSPPQDDGSPRSPKSALRTPLANKPTSNKPRSSPLEPGNASKSPDPDGSLQFLPQKIQPFEQSNSVVKLSKAPGPKGRRTGGVPNTKEGSKKKKKKPTKQWPLQVLQMAEALDISPVDEEEIMWVAEKAVTAPVKPPWAKYLEKDGSIFYYNAETSASQWRHPYEQEWRNVAREERQKHVAIETTIESDDDTHTVQKVVVYQLEPTFVPDPGRYAVLIASLVHRAHVYNHMRPAPHEWGLIKIAREQAEAAGQAEKAKSWYHASCRGSQIPYVTATFELFDKVRGHDPRAGETGDGTGDGTHLNGETIVSMDLSLNNITSLKSGSLAAFVCLRMLNLSTNGLSSTEGLGVSTGLVELDLSNNRFKTPSDLRGDAALVTAQPGLVALRNLQTLSLDHNRIFNIKPLLRLTTLTSLGLASNQLKNLWGIETLTNLCTLGARDNLLVETTQERELQYPEEKAERVKMQPSLTELDLAGNQLNSMDALLECFHPDCELVALDLQGNKLTEDISHRYILLDRFQSLVSLDNQEVKPAMRRQLADMHRQEKIKGIAQAVKDSYLERLVRERQRKDWGVEALRSQEQSLEDLFMQMQAKMEAEVLRTTSQMLINKRQHLSENMVKRARELAAKLRESQEKDALAFAEQVPRGSAVSHDVDIGLAGMGLAQAEAEALANKDRDEIRRKQLRSKVKAVMAAQGVATRMWAK